MQNIKIISISDIHGILPSDLPNGDILTISGDICPVNMAHDPSIQLVWINNYFYNWCKKLISEEIFKHIVFIAGNHDFIFFKEYLDSYSNKLDSVKLYDNVHYLLDSSIELLGVKIYGSPWSTLFGNWAFMKSEEILDNLFSKIPNNIDILLVHSPVKGYNDVILQYPEWNKFKNDKHLGSFALRKHVLISKPKFVCCGHIHSGDHNPSKILDENMEMVTILNNVSILDENYEYNYNPYQINIEVNK